MVLLRRLLVAHLLPARRTVPRVAALALENHLARRADALHGPVWLYGGWGTGREPGAVVTWVCRGVTTERVVWE